MSEQLNCVFSIKISSFINSNCNDEVSIGCDNLSSSAKCTQTCLENVSTKLCHQYNRKVDKCNGVKIKEINMNYEQCVKKAKRDFIMAKCDTIKNKYVPLGLGRF